MYYNDVIRCTDLDFTLSLSVNRSPGVRVCSGKIVSSNPLSSAIPHQANRRIGPHRADPAFLVWSLPSHAGIGCSPVRLLGVQAEWVPRGIKKHANVVLGLVLRLHGTELDRVGDRRF